MHSSRKAPCTDIFTQSETLSVTEPNYRHLSLSDETENCSIFRLMDSEDVCFFSPSQRLLSSLYDAAPAARPLIWCLILNLLNKTQIKTDNEESFPLSATFICFDFYSESRRGRVCFLSGRWVKVTSKSLRLASLVVKQSSCAHPWPSCSFVSSGFSLGSSRASALQNMFHGRSV